MRKQRKAGGHAGMTQEQLGHVAERFRVLSSPSRLQILQALMQGPCTVGKLGEDLDLEQSNLSRHLGVLARSGCIRRMRQGREVTVEIADPTLEELCTLVCGSLKTRAERATRQLS